MKDIRLKLASTVAYPQRQKVIKLAGSWSRPLIVAIALCFYSKPLSAQDIMPTMDAKHHDVGQVRQLVTNKGTLWNAGVFWGYGNINCEYPPNSGEDHFGEAGIWVGAIIEDTVTQTLDTLVSVTCTWNPHIWWMDPPFYNTEFWASTAPWDSIWVAGRGETVDIPYWPGYVGLSEQDFICRYNDYNVTAIRDHKPLYIDVIQTSHAWGYFPLDEIIFYKYYVIPTRYDLKELYITYWVSALVGERFSSIPAYPYRDDLSGYKRDLHMAYAIDTPGGIDGNTVSPIGFQMFPPKDVPADEIKWTFIKGETSVPGITPARDVEKYEDLMATDRDRIDRDQLKPGGTHFIVSFGPFDVSVGDTLEFGVGEILGVGMEGMVQNAERLAVFEAQDFNVPSPPPMPDLEVTTGNHQVQLTWEPTAEHNPETYHDHYRADSAEVPFEGYRLYKSTDSDRGPWTLLGEYDLTGDEFGSNLGLQHQYTDYGLLNNIEYYYTLTAYSKPDTALPLRSLESSQNGNAMTVIPGTAIQETIGKVAAVPNPYLGSIDYSSYNPAWEKPPPGRPWLEQDRRLQFINLPAQCVIKIYTAAGDRVATVEHNDQVRGFEDWDMTSHSAQAIASGIYLFTVQDTQTDEVQVGKFVVIK